MIGAIEPRCNRRNDVRHPQTVGRGSEEVPLHQIRDHLCLLAADSRSDSFAAADALQSGCPHQAGDPLHA